MNGLRDIWSKALEKYNQHKQVIPTAEEQIIFQEPPPCIKHILDTGVPVISTRNALAYRLAGYFKSQGLPATQALAIMNDWVKKITPDKTHEVTYEGRVDYDKLMKENQYVINTVYRSDKYWFSCNGIRSVEGVQCSEECRANIAQEIKVSLFDATRAEYYGKRIAVDVEVIGRRDTVRVIPKVVNASCSILGAVADTKIGRCEKCPLYKIENLTFTMGSATRGIYTFIEYGLSTLTAKLAKIIGIPKECVNWTYKVLDTQNVEVVFISPKLTNEAIDSDRYTRLQAFFLGHGLQTTQAYRLSGYFHIDERTSEVHFIFDKASELSDSLSEFQWQDSMKEESKIFQPRGISVREKHDEIIDNLNKTVIMLWGREHMIKVVDLTFYSVRKFYFQNRLVKGWLDTLIIGDSGQGKTECVERLMKHYRAGYLASAESATRAGLLYGIDTKAEGGIVLYWGALPRYTGRIVIIDEAKKIISDGDFGKLTRARSSGIVEVDTIVAGRALCETRLITMTNTLDRQKMGSYVFPVQAVADLIPGGEDIRRFDLVVGVMSNEIPDEIIHKNILEIIGNEEQIYTSTKCSNLLYFVWNLQPEDIIYSEKVQQMTLDLSLDMCKKYSSDIPIVEPADQRLKLARVACAIAGRMYMSDGKKLEVTEECVQYAYDLMNELYTSPALNYSGFSEANAKRTISEEAMEVFIKQFKTHGVWGSKWREITNFFKLNAYVKKTTLAAASGLSSRNANECLNWLASKYLTMNVRSDTWVCTANGAKFFRILIDSIETDKTKVHLFDGIEEEEDF